LESDQNKRKSDISCEDELNNKIAKVIMSFLIIIIFPYLVLVVA